MKQTTTQTGRDCWLKLFVTYFSFITERKEKSLGVLRVGSLSLNNNF